MNRHGQDDLLQAMKQYGIPVTRENYLDLAYMGKPPEMTAELESNLPPEIHELRENNQLSTGGTASLAEQHQKHTKPQVLRTVNPPPSDDFLEMMGNEL